MRERARDSVFEYRRGGDRIRFRGQTGGDDKSEYAEEIS